MGKRSDLREAYKKRRGVPSLLNPTDDEHRYTAAKKQFDSLVHLLHLVQHSPVPIPELEMKNAVSLALEEVERWSQEVERLDLRLGHTLRLGDPEEILPPFLTAVDDLDVKVSACEYFGRSAMPRSDRLAVMAQGRRARLRYAARMAKVCHDKVVIRQIEDPAHASALQALAAATLDELDALPRLRNLSTEELVRATIRIHDAAISLDHFLDRVSRLASCLGRWLTSLLHSSALLTVAPTLSARPQALKVVR